MLSRLYILTPLVLFVCVNAHAQDPTDYESLNHGFFAEPGVSYQFGKTVVNYPEPLSNSTGSADGVGLSAKLGAHFYKSGFFAADFRYALPRFKDSSVNYDAAAKAMNWGPMLGMQVPFFAGPRIWATYIVGGELDPDASGSFDVKFKDPEGLRIGIGFRVSIVSLNIEYEQLKYKQSILEKMGPFNLGTNLDSAPLKDQSWIASVTFPLYL